MAADTQKQVTFYAKCHNQLLVIEPGFPPTTDQAGRIISPGKVPVEVQFEGGNFSTQDPDLIATLRDHRLFNVAFWEHGNAPDEPKPSAKEQLTAITKATADRDAAAIQAVLDAENETHKRPVVIDAAKAALEALEGDKPNPVKPPEKDSSPDELSDAPK